MQMINRFKKAICLFLAFALLLSLCACGSGEAVTYTVTVKTEGGMPLESVEVKVYKDKGLKDIVWIAETDDEGKTSFTAESSDEYTVILEDVPQGYKSQESYTIKDENAVVTVKPDMIKSDELSDVTYDLGSVVRDFSVTDVNGTKYQISEILKEKKAVVLNFWFLNCQPCRMEFPFLQKAYEQYSKDIEVLAINPLDGNDSTITAFAKDNGLTFPVIKGDSDWANCMRLMAYPTTVVIDRYGSVVMMHRGSITEDGVFESIFEYFASDDYVQGIIKNLSDIK